MLGVGMMWIFTIIYRGIIIIIMPIVIPFRVPSVPCTSSSIVGSSMSPASPAVGFVSVMTGCMSRVITVSCTSV